MTRSAFSCRCGQRLGWVNRESRTLHPEDGVTVVFIDLVNRTATLKCRCGRTMQYAGPAIDLR